MSADIWSWQYNIENTDNSRTIEVLVRWPDFNRPMQYHYERYTIYPKTEQTVAYFKIKGSAEIESAHFK